MGSIHIPEITSVFIVLIIDTDTFYLMTVIILTRNTIHTEPINILNFDQFRAKFIHRPGHISIRRCPIL